MKKTLANKADLYQWESVARLVRFIHDHYMISYLPRGDNDYIGWTRRNILRGIEDTIRENRTKKT